LTPRNTACAAHRVSRIRPPSKIFSHRLEDPGGLGGEGGEGQGSLDHGLLVVVEGLGAAVLPGDLPVHRHQGPHLIPGEHLAVVRHGAVKDPANGHRQGREEAQGCPNEAGEGGRHLEPVGPREDGRRDDLAEEEDLRAFEDGGGGVKESKELGRIGLSVDKLDDNCPDDDGEVKGCT